ncbi:maltase 2-like [Planococcus citri]|uniref:maltase 2-like n=1 Tax=Planococcus citri TaxID=170843 RepID=UPI0031F77904
MKLFAFFLFCLFCKSFAADLDRSWWKHTIIYEILPFSFKDSDGDGRGDIKGITSKLDHFVDLGIETIHLTPVYETSMRDMGYDITDYYKIDQRYGTMEDFDELMAEMKKRGLKLILDLVINHCGYKNEWFLKSIDKIDPYTDYYVWKDAKEIINGTPTPPNKWRNIFHYYDGSAWEWNEKRQQFYLHQFLPEQPDFNLGNENVKKELKKIITFWLDKGVAGFRLDAAPHFFEDKEFRDDSYDRQKDQPETMEFIHEFRLFLDDYSVKQGGFERIYVAEARGDLAIAAKYYGTKEYPLTHFPYGFILEFIDQPMRAFWFYWYIYVWMSYLQDGDVSAWMSQDHDGSRVGSRVVPEYSDIVTMLSMMLPGTVGVYYGQEIGMLNGFITPEQIRDYSGNDGRDPVRLLMQWDNSTSAGFSTNATTFLPSNSDYFIRNVEFQKKDEFSQYNMFKDLSALRKTDTLKVGQFNHLPYYHEDIYMLQRMHEGHEVVLVINPAQSLIHVNLTRLMRNPPNPVSVVTASTNAGYGRGLTLDHQSLDKFKFLPLSAVVFETKRPKNEKKSEEDGDL